MKFLAGLFGRKASTKHQTQPVSGIEVDANWNVNAAEDTAIPAPDASSVAAPSIPVAGGESVVNIWDIDEGAAPTAQAAPKSEDGASRSRRNRTRLIGFDKSDGEVVDLFDGAPKVAATGERTQFPVGMLLVVEGPGRGFGFPLKAGMSSIGRGDDQAVALDFGDNAISRTSHAAIVYDTDTRGYTLGHGGKANIVRLNGKPVISNETMNDGDKIQLGETTLQLKTFCNAEFDWADSEGAEDSDDDVAIA
jgi:hypothetical protein